MVLTVLAVITGCTVGTWKVANTWYAGGEAGNARSPLEGLEAA